MKRSATKIAVVAVLIFVLHGSFLRAQDATAISHPTPTIAGAPEESGTASVASSDNLPDAPSSQQQSQTQTQNQNQTPGQNQNQTPSQNQSQTQGQNENQNQN